MKLLCLLCLKAPWWRGKPRNFKLFCPWQTTLCNSPDNIINDYKWNEYFVTVKCSAYKPHIKGALNMMLRHTDSVDMRLMSQGEWEAVIKRFLCITDQFSAFFLPMSGAYNHETEYRTQKLPVLHAGLGMTQN